MKTKNTPKIESDLKTKIKSGYMDFILTAGKNPESVYHFCKTLGIEEADFYRHFSSFASIETSVWADTLTGVLQKLEANEDYANFGIREKLLSFFFALTEEMRSQRSFFIRSSANWFIPGKASAAKNALEQEVKPFFEKLVAEGFQTGELADRAKISDYYPRAMMVQFWFIIQFWMTDESRDFEDTDAAIEKGVNLGFDLMKENTLDKAFDLAKFLWGRAKTR
jgi:AcrR family transcriptional regulator